MIDPSQGASHRISRATSHAEKQCGIHSRELVLYCEHCEVPVCIDCTTQHPGHGIRPLDTAVPWCKEELDIKLKVLDEKYEFFKRLKRTYNATSEYIQSQAQQTEKLIKTEFEKLHGFLSEAEAGRIAMLREEEELKKRGMAERIASLNRDIAALTDLIRSVKREMGADNLCFLQNFQALKRRAQWTAGDPPEVPDSLINVAQHLGDLSFRVWEQMQSRIPHIPVILDPNTASPWLSLSPGMSGVSGSKERLPLPDNGDRFDPCVFVLGSEGFSSGRHSWDVCVGENPKWIVGVCKKSLPRKRKFTMSPKSGVWSVGLSKGVYSALTVPRTQLHLQKLEKIRVKLNCEKGTVSFWDPSNEQHICTFNDAFTEPVFPLLGPGIHAEALTIAPTKVSIHY
ncbi:hypothetical protein COCON_G00003750 [Conger conger]|uniref:Uncharacterized protein n=1 Tax=Conger conger TaxID=82655 RepID=A0A9Q1I8D5_CONCO|nr:hypothetical protein COCON_G00003750 [Conger conger]